MGVGVIISAGVVANPGLVGLVVLHGVGEHRVPFEVGLIGGAGVVAFERDFGILSRDADGDFTACQEVEVASN